MSALAGQSDGVIVPSCGRPTAKKYMTLEKDEACSPLVGLTAYAWAHGGA
jgi:hypothetical protein